MARSAAGRLARLPHVPLPRLPRPSRKLVAGALVTLAVLIPAGFWLRDSSLVAVEHVHVSGISGPQAAEVRQALRAAAERMTTLHVDDGALRAAVRDYPVVAGVRADGKLLHTLDITVHEHLPVGALSGGGQRVAVAADGTILADTPTSGLPLVSVGAPPGGREIVGRRARLLVALLADAPRPLLRRVSRVGLGKYGLMAWLSRGPVLRFGPSSRLAAKWIAAARVLADSSSRGAEYVDLRVPERPAAGGLVSQTDPTATAGAANPQLQVQPVP